MLLLRQHRAVQSVKGKGPQGIFRNRQLHRVAIHGDLHRSCEQDRGGLHIEGRAVQLVLQKNPVVAGLQRKYLIGGEQIRCAVLIDHEADVGAV